MISCRDCALRLISFKDRTQKEIYERLKEKGYTDEQIFGEIDFLKEYGYIDDVRYAQRYVKDCITIKKWGAHRIRTELLRRGIDRETIEPALDAAEEETGAALYSEMKKRFSDADMKSPKERRRIFSYFARRGFAAEKIRGAMNEMCSFEDIVSEEEFKEVENNWL